MSKKTTIGGKEVKAKRIKTGLYLLGNSENENFGEKLLICRNYFVLRNPYNTRKDVRGKAVRIMSMEDNVITTDNINDEFYYAIYQNRGILYICKVAKDGNVNDNLISREIFPIQGREKISNELAKILSDFAIEEEVAVNN
jgi:hypothetical protein